MSNYPLYYSCHERMRSPSFADDGVAALRDGEIRSGFRIKFIQRLTVAPVVVFAAAQKLEQQELLDQ